MLLISVIVHHFNTQHYARLKRKRKSKEIELEE